MRQSHSAHVNALKLKSSTLIGGPWFKYVFSLQCFTCRVYFVKGAVNYCNPINNKPVKISAQSSKLQENNKRRKTLCFQMHEQNG